MSNSTLPLVLIPGMMCDQRLFTHQLSAFQNHRDIIIARTDDGSSMESIAEAIFAQIPWSRFALAGLSMGGIIAMEMARQHPELIAGLALMDTNPWAESEAIQANRTPQIEMAFEGRHLEVIQHQMAPKYGGSDIEQEAQLSLVLAMARDLGQDVFIQQSLALRNRQDQSESLKNFTGNSITLCGEFDQLCPVDRHQAIATMMPNCQLHVIPNAGHLITLQAPQATNTHLKNWLETLI